MGGLGRLTAAVAGVLVLVSGCTTVVAPPPGFAHGVPDYRPPKPDVAKILGDLTTLDPCSLTMPADFGAVTAKPMSFDECGISIPGGATISVGMVDKVDTFQARGTPTEFQGMSYSIYSTPIMPCGRLLLFGDDLALSVHMLAASGEGAAAQCDKVAEGFEKMLKRLKSSPKSVKHRTFPPASFGRVDACAVMPAAVVSALPTVRTWPSKHTCAWSDAGTQNELRVSFGVGELTDLPGNAIEVAGRKTEKLEEPMGDDAGCLLLGAHQVPHGDHEMSVLNLVRKGVKDAAAVCDQAVQYANQLWPVLPTP